MIDRIVERLTAAIERVLALALIAAIFLNFANVIGRYGLGHSILSADEIQIYVMIWITFLGAAVVTWRNRHLRMDVIVRLFPQQLQSWARVFELVLLLAVAIFTCVQSVFYARQMVVLGRTSDTAGVPMWIPHGAVALGFGLIALIVLVRILALFRNDSRTTGRTEPTR